MANYFFSDLGRPGITLNDSDDSHYIRLEATGTTSGSYTLKFPAATGSANQILKTDGSGNLSWTTNAGLSGLGGTDHAILRTSGTEGATAQGSGITIDDSDNVASMGTLGCGAITTTGTLTLGAGGDEFTITESSDDITIASGISDKDMIFTVNDGGSATEVMRLDGDVSALKMASSKKIMLGAAEEFIYGDGTDIHFGVGANGNINIPANIGLTFGDDAEKIEGDGTDLTISGNNIKLTATADVIVPADVGITFGTGEKIEGNNTDLTITSGAKINLTATSDVVIPANVGVTFGDGEKIEGDDTDLTITSGGKINLTATSDVVVPANVGITFGTGEKIEGDNTNLTITSGAGVTFEATSNVTLYTKQLSYQTQTLTVSKVGSGGSNGDISSTTTPGTEAVTAPIVYFNALADSANGTFNYSFTQTSNIDGEIKHLFFDNSADSDVKLRVGFGSDVLAAGSGLAEYLTFDSNGQSATLIYVGSKWRIINTGAAVS